MVENRSSLFGIIAIIIGASGLGIGAFSVVNFQTVEGPQGIPGDDGQDGTDGQDGEDGNDAPIVENIYYCSSQSEIEDALDIIGSGHGAIIIMENITLTSTLTIDDGGHYIIQGAGLITLDRNTDDETLNISNVKSCTIKDIIVDASDITSDSISGIYINEGNNNPVYIQNVQIYGGNGRGILVISENVWIENCFIHDVRVGILLAIGSLHCHILDNSIFAVNPSTGYAYGIYADVAESLTISGNVVYDITVSAGAEASGISLENSYSSTISDNVVHEITSSSGNAIGIYSDGSFDSISGNTVHDITSDSGIAHGMWLLEQASSISGNIVHDIRSDSVDAYGIRFTSISSTFTSNTIVNVFPFTGYGDGIYGSGNNNVIIGNTLYDCGTITVTGTGNVIDHNSVYNT